MLWLGKTYGKGKDAPKICGGAAMVTVDNGGEGWVGEVGKEGWGRRRRM